MIQQTIKNLIKKGKKEKETLILYCNICLMETTARGTPIRVKAMQKEFKRLHQHQKSFVKRLINFMKRGR